jgi:hypothetical protein
VSAILLVPVNGPFRVVNAEPDGIEALLHSYAEGRYVDFGIRNGDSEIGRVGFLIYDGPQDINARARAMLADLTGVHMVITGTAAFSGLPDERFQELLVGHG